MLKHIKSRDDWNERSFSAKGFTLIELLVVIVILGILAAVVTFAVSGIGDKGQKNACITEAKTVRTAMEAYAANPTLSPTGAYPSSFAQMTAAGNSLLQSAPTLVAPGTGGLPNLAWTGACTPTVMGTATP